MTLEYIDERLKYIGRPMNAAQKAAIIDNFGNNACIHQPLESKVPLIEASVTEKHCYILHENGIINREFDENEVGCFGMMVWKDNKECNIILAFF